MNEDIKRHLFHTLSSKIDPNVSATALKFEPSPVNNTAAPAQLPDNGKASMSAFTPRYRSATTKVVNKDKLIFK